MNVNDFISKENASQKFNPTNSIAAVNKKPLNTPIFDEYADSDNRKNKESDLKEMNGTCKRGDITVGFPVSLKKSCYLEQSTEAQNNKLISKTQNEDSISLLMDDELIKASNLSEVKSKSTAAVQPPPGYSQPIYKDDLKLNIEHATIRVLNVTLNDDQAIDIDEEQDEGQDEELEASLLYANFIENQKKQLINSASIVEKPPSVDSCYNLLEDDIIDKRESLYEEYKKFFYETECHCEPSQNIYSMRDGKLSKPLQRKLLTLDQIMRSYQAPLSDRLIGFDVNSKTSYEKIMEKFKNGDDAKALLAYTAKNQDHKNKLFRLLRSICERVLIYDISLCDQFHYQVQQQQDQQQNLNSNNMDDSSTTGSSSVSSTIATNPLKVLWNEMRNRSCQFLGPQVQEDVLNFVLRALEQFPRLSRRVLVYYVVFMLKKDYPKVSKTSIGHVVQLLYRAGCFKVEKRDKDASLMELKREYTKYEALRRQHDAQIIQIGMESGIRMTPEKWSQTLYGDSAHKSEMQSIIDKLQSLHTFEQLIIDFYGKIKSYGLEDISSFDEKDFEFIASINFEKKQPRTANSILDEEDNNDPLNDSKTKVPSSAQSEEDQNNEYQDTLSENFDFTNDSDLMRRRSSIQQKSETQNVHILWALLCECQKRAFNILKAHADFSSKIMNKIIANQNIIIATNSSQHGGQSSYRGPNSMSGSGGYSQQQPWSQNRPQNARAPYRHQNNPHYVSNYDKRNQESLNNHGLKAMGTNNNQPYRQQQQFRNISNSTGVSTGFSNRTSTGYQNRGSITNSSGYSTWNDSLSTNSYADPDEMVNSIPQSSFFYNNQDQQVFQPFSSNKVQHQKPSSWGGAQYAYNPSNNKQMNMANMKQRTVATTGNMNLNQHNATIKK